MQMGDIDLECKMMMLMTLKGWTMRGDETAADGRHAQSYPQTVTSRLIGENLTWLPGLSLSMRNGGSRVKR